MHAQCFRSPTKLYCSVTKATNGKPTAQRRSGRESNPRRRESKSEVPSPPASHHVTAYVTLLQRSVYKYKRPTCFSPQVSNDCQQPGGQTDGRCWQVRSRRSQPLPAGSSALQRFAAPAPGHPVPVGRRGTRKRGREGSQWPTAADFRLGVTGSSRPSNQVHMCFSRRRLRERAR